MQKWVLILAGILLFQTLFNFQHFGNTLLVQFFLRLFTPCYYYTQYLYDRLLSLTDYDIYNRILSLLETVFDIFDGYKGILSRIMVSTSWKLITMGYI